MDKLPDPEFWFDPFSPEMTARPEYYFKILRDNYPAYYNEEYDTYFFSRFDDVWTLLSTGDNTFVATESNLPTPEYLRSVRNDAAPPFVSTNPMSAGNRLPSPYYEEMRIAHIAPLRPKAIAGLRDFITDFVRERLDVLLPQGKFDLTMGFAAAVAAKSVCHLFELPESSGDQMMHDIGEIGRKEGSIDLSVFWTQMAPYIEPVVQARREAGADGAHALVDGLINYRSKPDGRALGNSEIVDQLVCAMVGGMEAVPKVTGRGIMELFHRPEQLAAVQADLDTNVPIVVEEMIRFCAPAQYTFRTAHKEALIGGQLIKPGQRVAAMLNSASRDEREFESPDAFIWNRKIPRVLSFGLGQHHCIGKHLAVLEIRIMVREFLERVKACDFLPDEGGRNTGYFQRGWTSLPIVVRN